MPSELTSSNLVSVLVAGAPSLKPIYDAHVAFNDELLEHLFLGEVTSHVVDCYRIWQESGVSAEQSKEYGAIKCILEIFEQAMSVSDKELHDLLALGFVENLFSEDDVHYRGVRRLLGEYPHLHAELQAQENWDSSR